MTRLRRTIAARLVEAQQTAALLTTFNEVNMQPVMDLRAQYKDAFEEAHGARLGFMSFFVKASTAALQAFPQVNAYIDGDDIVSHNYCDIGIAVSVAARLGGAGVARRASVGLRRHRDANRGLRQAGRGRQFGAG